MNSFHEVGKSNRLGMRSKDEVKCTPPSELSVLSNLKPQRFKKVSWFVEPQQLAATLQGLLFAPTAVERLPIRMKTNQIVCLYPASCMAWKVSSGNDFERRNVRLLPSKL